ncbi:hypothetical protein ZIOFF_002369 [Zingiber officinale]|uniref:Cyanobacterial aminoacyl-tRNA synthetase CAAD domain-containing protein n=1 Tax=Zingiber officinale TaxID=94328 RepID=A0A8J5HZR6_ZINOF|nr:hypothetical protein ZIOFF_002369 [Zingiber officinale]
MELSAPPRGLLSLRHLCRPFVAASTSPILSLHFPCPIPTKPLLSSRWSDPSPVRRSVLGFRDPGACLLRATVSDEEISTAGVVDDDAPKLVEGPSFLMNSNPSGEDNLDGGEAVDESTDSPLSKFDIKSVSACASIMLTLAHRNHFIVPQMDSEDTYPILFFGAGSLFALWISSAVISALDSVPVVPKVLEVIGLGFTAWFTSRYFIFKENRDEFFLKLQDVKERILGPSD